MDKESVINFCLEMAEVIYDEFNMEPNEPHIPRTSDDRETFVLMKKNAKDKYKLAKDKEAHHNQHSCNKNVTHCTINVDGIFIQLLDLHGTIA